MAKDYQKYYDQIADDLESYLKMMKRYFIIKHLSRKQYKKDVKAKNFKAAAADLDKAISVLQKVASEAFNQYDDILQVPQVLGVQELADSAVVIRMIAEVSPLQQWHIQRELRRLIKLTFDRENIEIPYSKMMVYQKNEGSPSHE